MASDQLMDRSVRNDRSEFSRDAGRQIDESSAPFSPLAQLIVFLLSGLRFDIPS
ncbi:MAG: hypothetical protein ACFB6S_05400 [Geminicoccaceae bacterium]